MLPHLLSQGRPPTAIFAASDFIALGLLRAAETYNLDVQRDLSLAGFDDIPLNSRLRPRLTSVAQPVDQIARVCIDLLAARIRTSGATPQTRTLPVTLTVRDSAAPLQPEGKRSAEVPHPRCQRRLRARTRYRRRLVQARTAERQRCALKPCPAEIVFSDQCSPPVILLHG